MDGGPHLGARHKLDAALHALRLAGFAPVGLPAPGGVPDPALLRLRGDLQEMLVLPPYGDATILIVRVAHDPTAPAWLLREVLTEESLPALQAALRLLDHIRRTTPAPTAVPARRRPAD
ncbi:hypothetical protein LV78_005385 [Actinosynnema pretiosum]|nr:hypothetical protein [Actinosynnema pretiosum]